MNKSSSSKGSAAPTTPQAAARVQAAYARAHGGKVPSGGQVARMQAAAARNFGKSGSK